VSCSAVIAYAGSPGRTGDAVPSPELARSPDEGAHDASATMPKTVAATRSRAPIPRWWRPEGPGGTADAKP